MKTIEISDKELVSNYLAGNKKAIETLIIKHKRKVFSYILLTIKDRQLAEDIFQEAFIKVINTLNSGNYSEEGKFLPWVMRISHNLIIDHFRKAKKIQTIDHIKNEFDLFDILPIYETSKEEELVKEQIKADVRKLIEFLPEEQKEVLFMRHFAEMSFKDIAEQKEISINTALGRMRYALINLRKLIEEKNIILTYN